jgi:galactokinase
MGDHLDHHEGLVLPVAIEPDTWIAFRRRRDGLVQLGAWGSNAGGSFWISTLAPETRPSRRSWLDYVAGTAWSLREAALPVRGLDGIVDSTVPAWAGSSWPASLELTAALALLGGGCPLGAPALAALAQRAERDYAGLDGDIVSQVAAAAGRAGHAILLDSRSLEIRFVSLPPGLMAVVCTVGAAGRSRATVARERRAECGRALLLLAERMPALASLRDLDLASLRRHRRLLPEKLARRAEHVVSENARVLATAAALENGDLDELGRCFDASHRSTRQDFELGSPATDAMVELAGTVRGVVAARMTAAACGECVVALVLEEAVPALVRAVETGPRSRPGLGGRAFPVTVANGAEPVAGSEG